MEYTDNKNEKFSVRAAEISDYLRVNQICDVRFGKGYLSKEEFANWVKDPDFCRVAVYNGSVVGLVYLMPEDSSSLANALKLDKAYIEKVSEGKGVIHSRCAVLDEAYECRGIMPILHDEIFDNIKKQGFGAIFAPAWSYNGFTPMKSLLDSYGFEFIGEKENIWYDMEGYDCIICKGRCKCNAAIFQKKIQ